jgi:hypothetical protein
MDGKTRPFAQAVNCLAGIDMSSNSLSERSWLWWVYGAYLLIAFVAGSYASITQASIGASGVFVIAVDAVALLGFYGFLRQRPIASNLFWQVFVLFYATKFISSAGLLIYVAIQVPWRGGSTDNIRIWGFAGAFLAIGLLYALFVYAFRAALMWRSRNASTIPDSTR